MRLTDCKFAFKAKLRIIVITINNIRARNLKVVALSVRWLSENNFQKDATILIFLKAQLMSTEHFQSNCKAIIEIQQLAKRIALLL